MFDWREYLTLAEHLSAREDEAALRSAISRAYYSIFRRAYDMLIREGVAIPDTGRSHQDVWRTLELAGRARRRLGVEGKRLCEARRRADYSNEIKEIRKESDTVMRGAKALGALLDQEERAAQHA